MLFLFLLVIITLASDSMFFFFKQKTAYEMRISDWSSDVCSSDLAGYATNPRYDSLLAKVIVQGEDLSTVARRARRALAEFKISGARTNIALLQGLLKSEALTSGALHTRYVEAHLPDLLEAAAERARNRSEEHTSEPQSLMRISY